MRDALQNPGYFGKVLDGSSWAAWRILLIALCGEPLLDGERDVYAALTGREAEPGALVEEAWIVAGRRSGKTRSAAILAAYFAGLVDHRQNLAPGERGLVPVLASTVQQSDKLFQYAQGIFHESPLLKKLVQSQTADMLSLKSGIDIQVRPASYRSIRGITAVAAIGDEVAFWGQDTNSTNPDSEILAALRPSLATTGGPLICITTPYAKRGEAYAAFKKHHGPTGDPTIIVARAPSRTLNPSLPEGVVRRAYERDAAVASAEYGAEFRSDIEAFLGREAIEACVEPGCFERPPISEIRYLAFVDPSGGSADSMTLAISHKEGEAAVLDLVREVKPPFSPEAVTAQFSEDLKRYGLTRVTGDRYAGEWPRERFAVHGITYDLAEMPKAAIYQAVLPLINSKRVDLLDHPRLAAQFLGLERRTARGGRDSIDHAPNGHDDVANAVAGALVLATAAPRQRAILLFA